MDILLEKIASKLSEGQLMDLETKTILNRLNEKLDLYEKIEKCLYDNELYLVYKHSDPSGKVYIGITQNHPQTRWNEGGGYEKQSRFYKAIQKYGWIHFKHEIVAAALSKDEAVALENELIIKYKSYDERYGYNTRVKIQESDSNAKVEEKDIRLPKRKEFSEISKRIVDTYSVKTINDVIYYWDGAGYIRETIKPFIEKLLITEYELPTRDHKEVFRQIKIISRINPSEMTLNEKGIFPNNKLEDIELWIQSNGLTISELTSIPTTCLYEKYIEWCKKEKRTNILGKKSFYINISKKYSLIKKQRTDGKRYFVSQI